MVKRGKKYYDFIGHNVNCLRNVNFYEPEFFFLEELVSRGLKLKYSDRVLWQRLNPRMLWTLDAIRILYNTPVWVNTWDIFEKNPDIDTFNMGGLSLNRLENRGLRDFDAEIGANYSLHKFGSAADFNIQGVSVEQFVKDVWNNPMEPAFSFITGLEWQRGLTWNHIDFRNYDKTDNEGRPFTFNKIGMEVEYA